MNLTTADIGKYAENIAAAFFQLQGFEVFRPDVDHGVDLLVRKVGSERVLNIQVKGVSRGNYAYIKQSSLNNLTIDSTLVCYILLNPDNRQVEDIYLIPLRAWDEPNHVFTNHTYDKRGQTSPPEFGINYSKKKSIDLLEPFRAEKMIPGYFD